MSNHWEKLIVALDLEDKNEINNVVKTLSPKGVKFKIGSIAFTKFGPDFVREFIKQGIDIFLDLKLYDIPNTMKRTAAVIAEMGCWAFTVHIKAGAQALAAVGEEVIATAKRNKISKPLVLGVTELTSSQVPKSKVLDLVDVAVRVGMDGVIASPQEIRLIKKEHKIKVVTPGIRSLDNDKGDQKRVATAKFAFSEGADFIVVGRPIINQKDYLAAATRILEG